MRFRPVLRAVALMFAAVMALAGPLTAVAHGVAHAETHAELLATVAGVTSTAPSLAVDDSADAKDHDGLHACNTGMVEPVSVALLTATVAVLVAPPVVRERVSAAWPENAPALSAERALADQPRAPPLG